MTKNIIVYTAESEGKIRDTTFFNEKNVLALEWCKEHKGENTNIGIMQCKLPTSCLLYTSDAADDSTEV